MSASKLNPIVMFANTTESMCYLNFYGMCKKLDMEIREFIYTKLKSIGWAVVKLDDLGKGFEAQGESITVEHQNAIDELDSAKHFYQTMVDTYECALTLEVLNALHEQCETINEGLVEKLRAQVRTWVELLREQAGDDQWRLRTLLALVNDIETLGEYHAKGIAAQLDAMEYVPVISTIWVDLKTRRIFLGGPNINVGLES